LQQLNIDVFDYGLICQFLEPAFHPDPLYSGATFVELEKFCFIPLSYFSAFNIWSRFPDKESLIFLKFPSLFPLTKLFKILEMWYYHPCRNLPHKLTLKLFGKINLNLLSLKNLKGKIKIYQNFYSQIESLRDVL